MMDRDGPPSLTGTPVPAAGFLSGLSGKLLRLTIVFVMIAEVLIFVPSVANMRLMWLRERLNTAAAASVVIEGLPDQELPRPVQDETLMATGTKAIVLKKADASRMVAVADMPPSVDAQSIDAPSQPPIPDPSAFNWRRASSDARSVPSSSVPANFES